MAGFGKRAGGVSPGYILEEPVGETLLKRPEPAPKLVASSGSAKGDLKSLIVSVVIVAALAGAGAAAASSFLFPSRPANTASAANGFDAWLAGYPDLAQAMASLKDHYRDDYARLMGRVADAARNNDARAASLAAFEMASDIGARDGHYLEHADAASLAAFVQSNLDMLVLLQNRSPELCAKAANGAIGPDDQLPPDAELAENGGRQLITMFNAIESGKTHPVDYDQPTSADQLSIGQMMLATGVTRQDAKALSGGLVSLKALPAEKQCSLMIKMFGALLASPDPGRSRVLANAAREAAHKFELSRVGWR